MGDSKIGADLRTLVIKFVVKLLNFFHLVFSSRKFTNTRWADILNDTNLTAFDFQPSQFHRIYLRFRAKYKFHFQQSHYNAYRNMDPTPALAARMATNGTIEYYKALTNGVDVEGVATRSADLSAHTDDESLKGCMENVVRLAASTNGESAQLVSELVRSGMSREIVVEDDDDWNRLRDELRKMKPKHNKPDVDKPNLDKKDVDIADISLAPDANMQNILPLAVSYKAKEETFLAKISISRRGDNDIVEEKTTEEVETTEKYQRTFDFLDDMRWDQIKRGARAYAAKTKYTRCSLWLDRILSNNNDMKKIYEGLNWPDFGLYPYMLMPSIRVYAPGEQGFGTDFWRKTEYTLAVAGKGLIVDDYMIRKYDTSIYYDGSIYKNLGNGIIMLGGNSTYIRSTVLALATMVLTDDLCMTKWNEHPDTIKSIRYWKSWAIRCASQEAFSNGPAVPIENDPVTVDLDTFKFVTALEFNFCKSKELTGASYLDMSYQRSLMRSHCSSWDGISEWLGMLSTAYVMDNRNTEAVKKYLNDTVDVSMYVAPSGHTASHLKLLGNGKEVIKSLVVETSRFSTQKCGNVLAIADATGHRGKSLLPWYLKHRKNPDKDQTVKIDQGNVIYHYEWRSVWFNIPKWIAWALLPIILCLIVLIVSFSIAATAGGIVSIFILLLIIIAIRQLLYYAWPWVDPSDVGEGVFDNVMLDSLYGAGIKKIYKRMRTKSYGNIKWK